MSQHEHQYRQLPSVDRVLRGSECQAAGMTSLLPQALLAVLAVALVAVVSLPQARVLHAGVGWIPLWLLGAPASAWCALWATRRRALAADAPTPAAALSSRRRSVVQARRRVVAAARPHRRVRAA